MTNDKGSTTLGVRQHIDCRGVETSSQSAMWVINRARLRERIPKRFQGGIETLRQRLPNLAPFLEAAERWVAAFSAESEKGLYIHGPVGCGKSALAYAIAGEIIKRGFDVEAWYIPDLYAAIKAGYDESGRPDEFEIVERCVRADLLVLDDLGTERVTEWSTEVVMRIVDRRYRECRPLIVTSNVTPIEIGAVDDLKAQRIASRLCEMTEIVRRLPGVDNRIPGGRGK